MKPQTEEANSTLSAGAKTMNSNASGAGRDKSVLLILCHIYQLITYLLFQFFPSLQPSCLRTLHLWRGDKKVNIQGW